VGHHDLLAAAGQADGGADESGQEVGDGGLGVGEEAAGALVGGLALAGLGEGAAQVVFELLDQQPQAIPEAVLGEAGGVQVRAIGGVSDNHANLGQGGLQGMFLLP